MSDDFYHDMAETAVEMINEFGAPGAIRRETPGTGPDYDPGEPTTTNHPAVMVVTAFSSREIDGTRIRASDKKALIAPNLTIEPTVSDKLVTPDGAVLNIVNVEVVRPATTTLLWKLQVRA